MKKILLVADVDNWAWHYKSVEIKRNLSHKYNIDIVYTSRGTPKYNPSMLNNYYHIHFFPWYHLGNEELKYKHKLSTSIASIEFQLTKPDKARAILPQLKVVAVSEVIYNLLKNNNLGKEIIPCYNGVNPSKFYPISNRKNPHKFVIGACCKPASKYDLHGYHLLMNIQNELSKYTDIECKFHIANYKNAVSHTELLQFYNSLDLFIHTGNYHLATPNPVFEASACSIPILATTNGCIPLLIKNNHNGILIDIFSKNKLYEFIKHILWFKNNKEQCVNMGKNNYNEILNNWTWKQRSFDWIKLFET